MKESMEETAGREGEDGGDSPPAPLERGKSLQLTPLKPERRGAERRRGAGGDRRKKPRRAPADGATHPAATYREWSDTLSAIAEAEHHFDRWKALLDLARDYARIADALDAIDPRDVPIKTEPSP